MTTILVVDDLVDNRRLLGLVLQRFGYNVLMATDGVEAMDLINREPPDLVLLDLNMPRMDGWQVCANVKADQRLQHIPIVAVTANCNPVDMKKLASPAWKAYFNKPFDLMALVDQIPTWLR